MSVISSITALIPGGPAYRSLPTASPTGQLPPPSQGSLLHSPLPITRAYINAWHVAQTHT